MRALGSLGLLVALAGTAAAQDTSIVIRDNSRNGKGSADTIITIRRAGQPDRVISVTRSLSPVLRGNLERQLEESRQGMARLRAGSLELQNTTAARARREAAVAGELRNLQIERQPSTLMLERQARAVDGQRIAELRELQAGSEVMARSARDLASHSMQVFAAKPRIGVYVDLTARDTDKYGAYVNAVTPGGPAAKAGVRTGDIITRIAGKSLTAPDSIRRGVDESAPGLRLIEVVSRLEAGKAVPLEVRRGNDSRKLTITPDDDQSMAYFVDGVPVAGSMAPAMRGGTINNVWAGRMMPTPEGAAEAPLTARFFENFNKAGADGRYSFVTAFGTALADLELAPINEKLGSYFGVTEGVLVIDVPEKANLGLVPGDVVTAVDGRKVSTPSQLMRVLATYDKGDEFKLQVTRQKRQETVSAKQP